MSKTAINLILSLLYSIYGVVFAYQTRTLYWWGLGILVGFVLILIFLALPAGQALMNAGAFDEVVPEKTVEKKKKIRQRVVGLEQETAALRMTEFQIPVGDRKRSFPIPSKVTIIYLIVAAIMIIVDRDNILFSAFMGLAGVTLWFNVFLYWRSGM
ncbi:MAG: hypothetical protein WCP97_09465 [bacterium]